MTYQFTKTDDAILDFLRDHLNEIMFQVEADGGKSVYYHWPLKVELTFGEPNYDN